MKKKLTLVMLAFLLSNCSSLEVRNKNYIASGYSFNLLGLKIPDDSLVLAEKEIPKEAETKNIIHHTPSSWSSLVGTLNRIIGVGFTQISGRTK